MKKLVIGLFVIGLTSLGFSQNNNGQVKEVKLDDVKITNSNFNYLEKVQGKETADYVSLLQNEAAKFNVFESSEFDGRKESFSTIFRGSKGYIIANYDNTGKILNTTERYHDIKLPTNIRKSVMKQYPNSGLLKVVYTVNYNEKMEAEKTYKIQIMINKTKQNLKISLEGDLDKAVTMNIVD